MKKSKSSNSPSCCCSPKSVKSAEDLVRDLINLVAVYQEEEKEDVTTRIDPVTAKELTKKLGELAKKVGSSCQCN